MVKYLSEDWRKEVEARLSAQLTPDKMNNLTSSMNNLYLNCPDGNSHYFFVGFVDGKVDIDKLAVAVIAHAKET